MNDELLSRVRQLEQELQARGQTPRALQLHRAIRYQLKKSPKLVLDMSQNLWYDRASELITHYQKGPPMSTTPITDIARKTPDADLESALETLNNQYNDLLAARSETITKLTKLSKANILKRFPAYVGDFGSWTNMPARTICDVLLTRQADDYISAIQHLESRLHGVAQDAPDATSEVEISHLLEQLRAATTIPEKKKIRAKLRRMGHTGGLR